MCYPLQHPHLSLFSSANSFEVEFQAPNSTTWDSRGNLASDPTSGKNYTYWPSTNQLWTFSSPWTAMAYDPLDRLAIVDSATDTKFAYDELDTLAEYDGRDYGDSLLNALNLETLNASCPQLSQH